MDDEERLQFEDGDFVVFSKVKALSELNDCKPRKVMNVRPYSFHLEDTTNFGRYEMGGIVTQVKKPKLLNFKPLKEAIENPGKFLLSDFSKFDCPPLLHLAFCALDKFSHQFGHFPCAAWEEDGSRFIDVARALNESSNCLIKLDASAIDENVNVFKHFASGSRAVLNPMAAMFGGIVGQEVVKACSGKFHSLFQVLFLWHPVYPFYVFLLNINGIVPFYMGKAGQGRRAFNYLLSNTNFYIPACAVLLF